MKKPRPHPITLSDLRLQERIALSYGTWWRIIAGDLKVGLADDYGLEFATWAWIGWASEDDRLRRTARPAWKADDGLAAPELLVENASTPNRIEPDGAALSVRPAGEGWVAYAKDRSKTRWRRVRLVSPGRAGDDARADA